MNNTTYLIYLILDIVAWIKKKLIQILCLSYTCDILEMRWREGDKVERARINEKTFSVHNKNNTSFE
jgi:hypothetical protein